MAGLSARRSIGAQTGATTRPATTFGAVVVAAVVVSAGTLGGCTGSSGPSPTTSTSTSRSTSSTSTAATSTSATSGTATPTPVHTPPTSTLVRYDVTSLIGSNDYSSPAGVSGPHGGVLLPQTVGVNTVVVRGATGPVSMYIPCCTDFGHLMLDYQVGSSTVDHPTQIPIGDDQGIVLDGRLIAIHAIMRVGSQPRVQAQVIVFPASASAGLPIVK